MEDHEVMLDWALNKERPLIEVIEQANGSLIALAKPKPADFGYPRPITVEVRADDVRYAYFAGAGPISWGMPEPKKKHFFLVETNRGWKKVVATDGMEAMGKAADMGFRSRSVKIICGI